MYDIGNAKVKFFFFSSRRRHTRLVSDWSSDVCSSDLSVTERTKEIGLRKAVGATRSNILWQFLIEAVVLTGIGGLLGLAVGELASILMNKYSPLPAFVPPWAIGVGVGISAAVGIVFGLW